jgi:tetratricopeptide (TPR) repeat protein
VDQKPKTKSQLAIVAGETGFQPSVTGKLPTGNDLPVMGPSLDVDGKNNAGLGPVKPIKPIDLDFSKLTAALLPTPIPASIETAEGYLELVTKPAVCLGVSNKIRRSYAKKAIELATSCGLCPNEPKHEARRQMVIGQAHRLLRRYRTATAAFRSASKYRPLRVEALLAMGWCQKRSGKLNEAVVSLTRALAIVPDDARLHYNLACYLACLGQHRAAVYELAWALELQPKLQSRSIAEPDFDCLRLYPAFIALTQPRVIV